MCIYELCSVHPGLNRVNVVRTPDSHVGDDLVRRNDMLCRCILAGKSKTNVIDKLLSVVYRNCSCVVKKGRNALGCACR